MSQDERAVSKATLKRLPTYLRYLRAKEEEGATHVSSVQIAEDLSLNSVQVKKDIALVSSEGGKPKVGFSLTKLIEDLESFLGVDNEQNAVLCGVGKLGSAILSYKGFEKYGLSVTAGFDVNESLFGNVVRGVRIYSMESMAEYVKKHKIYMAILTVQAKDAQAVTDELVKAGVLAILNFAPTHLTVPPTVAVQNVDIAASLAILSSELKDILEKKKN